MTARRFPKGGILFLCTLSFIIQTTISADEDVKKSLLRFYSTLSGGVPPANPNFGWNITSDPCTWTGVVCTSTGTANRVALEGLQLDGTLDMKSICAIESLSLLSIRNNSVKGEIPDQFSNCSQLSHLYLSDNKLVGALPESLSQLSNLKRLDISNNHLSGHLPDLTRISGLLVFLAQNNVLSGPIPQLDFDNLQQFNVSYNNFSGAVPTLNGHFSARSFMGNPLLCGKPLDKACTPAPSPYDAYAPALPPEDGTTSKSKSAESIRCRTGLIIFISLFLNSFVFSF